MKIVNLTPHAIVIQTADESRLVIESSGVARVSTTSEQVGEIDGIPIRRVRYGEIVGLPDPQPGTIYVTSIVVAQAAAKLGRTDVLAPDTGPDAIRDEAGRIVAVRGFIRPE